MVGYLKAIPYTEFEHFGIFRLTYAADKQTNRQTDELEHATHADRHWVLL